MSSIQEDDFDTIESGYEFLLAYAAQGRPPHKESDMPPPHAGPTLQGMLEAMQRIASGLADSSDDFEQLIVADIHKASAAVRFTLAQPLMSSELVDNLNASIHLRAVLTNSFLYSEKFRPAAEVKAD